MNRDAIATKLNSYLAEHKLKRTSQRDDIIDAFLKSSGKHITIEELHQSVKKINDAIGYTTVYRTLMLLVDAGIASQRHFQEGQSQFELVDEDHHDHLICTDCGKIIEFENDAIEKLQETVAKQFGFHLTGHRMELYGVCCKKKSKKS